MSVPTADPTATSPPDDVRVVDVVVRLPKTLDPDATVADARALLADDHVHLLLLTERGRLLGTLAVSDLPPEAHDADPALDHAILDGRTISAQVGAEEARQWLLATGRRRVAVVDDDGRLLGLLCLKRRLAGFCSDADVAARAAERAAIEARHSRRPAGSARVHR